MSDVKVTVENGVKELVIREGQADIIEKPKQVSIAGTITAPRLFVEKRKSEIKKLGTNVIYDPNLGKITLTIDETNQRPTTISGVLKLNPDLVAFNINTTSTKGLKEIQNFLRMNRVHFANREENESLLKKLSEFFARITIEINKKDDRKGNTLDSVQTAVSHEIPLLFKLKMPIYQGFEEKVFSVEIVSDITDANVKFWFESVELAELLVSDRKKILDSELNALSEYVIIEV